MSEKKAQTLVEHSWPHGWADDSAEVDKTIATPMESPAQGATFQPLPGSYIAGRYQILELLGEGGMGFVYRVLDTQLDEIVALKLLRSDLLGNDEAINRFKQEVRLARKVTHRNVARTYDLGQHEGIFFLTMEYIQGLSLGELITRSGGLPLEQALPMALALCEGMAAAHEAHVIHRDLKPSNVLLAYKGRVVISDFGIAGVDVGTDADATGSPLGTPAYMSPEQLQGRHDIDHRADLYSFGLLLYEALAGRRAWTEQNPFSLIFNRLSGEMPPALSELRPDLPQELLELVERCLRWERGERIQSAGELVAILRRLQPSASGIRPAVVQKPSRAPRSPQPSETLLRIRSLAHKEATPTQMGSHRVAVLPFRTGAKESFLAEGVTEDLIDLLSVLSGIKVRSSRMVSPLVHLEMTPRELGEVLQVDVVVEGSLQQQGEQLQLRTRMLSTDDGEQIWARRFRCSTGELFQIGEQLASAIADALALDARPDSRLTTEDPRAVELYFKARYELRRRWHGDLTTAVELFAQALELAPQDPMILVGAAMAQTRWAFYDREASKERSRQARILVERAIALSPHRGEPFYALALVRYYELINTKGAVDALCTCLERMPSFPEANELLGRILLEIGPLQEGMIFLQRALSLDPLLLGARWDLMRGFALQGQWDEVDRLGDLPVEYPTHQVLRAIVRARLDLWREQPRWVGESRPQLPSEHGLLNVGLAALFTVRSTRQLPESYIQRVRPWLEIGAEGHRYQLAVIQALAEIFAFVGQEQRALQLITSMLDQGLLDLMWLEGCPLFENLRQMPAFAPLHQRLQDRAQAILDD